MAKQETQKEPSKQSTDDPMVDESSITRTDDSTSSDEEIPLVYHIFSVSSSDEETPTSSDAEEKSTDEGDQKENGKEVASTSGGEGFHVHYAVGMHLDSLNMEGFTDEDVVRFSTYTDPVKRGNLSKEELKECKEGARRVEVLLKKWDAAGFWEGLAELGPDREELDKVVKEINLYYSKNSIVAVAVEVVAQLESKLRWLKEENVQLIAEKDQILTLWSEWLDLNVKIHRHDVDFPMMENENESLYYSKILNHLEAESLELAGIFDGLKSQKEELDHRKLVAHDYLMKSGKNTFSLVGATWRKILDLERGLALKSEDLDPYQEDRKTEQELEARIEQLRSELERSDKENEKLESNISGLMEAQENVVEELRKRQMEEQRLENELKEKNEVIKKLKEEFRRKKPNKVQRSAKGNE